MILLYAACVIAVGVLAPSSLRAIRSAVRRARVARELDHIQRATYRERFAGRDRT